MKVASQLLHHADLHGALTQLETLKQQLRRLQGAEHGADMRHQVTQALAHVIYAAGRLETVLRHEHLTEGRKG